MKQHQEYYHILRPAWDAFREGKSMTSIIRSDDVTTPLGKMVNLGYCCCLNVPYSMPLSGSRNIEVARVKITFKGLFYMFLCDKDYI